MPLYIAAFLFSLRSSIDTNLVLDHALWHSFPNNVQSIEFNNNWLQLSSMLSFMAKSVYTYLHVLFFFELFICNKFANISKPFERCHLGGCVCWIESILNKAVEKQNVEKNEALLILLRHAVGWTGDWPFGLLSCRCKRERFFTASYFRLRLAIGVCICLCIQVAVILLIK